jgi:TonB family protein
MQAPPAPFEEPPARTPQPIATPNIDAAAPNIDLGPSNINMGVPGLIAGNLPANVTRPAPPPVPLPPPAVKARELRPATPLHAPQPSFPAGVNLPDYAFDRPFQVQVEVSISASGQVTAARLVASSGPYATLLGPAALNTARVWTFHPATLGGEPVPSTMVLTFHYSHPR